MPGPGKLESTLPAAAGRVGGVQLALLSLLLLPLPVSRADEPSFQTRSLRGKVVWLAAAMERMHGVQSVPEAKERILALETNRGELHPLVEDIRGRAFRRDPRLRGLPVELLVRQQPGSPMAQVVKVFALDQQGKHELDYWCEICAIAMYELKACDCCQGPIELRRRTAADDRSGS